MVPNLDGMTEAELWAFWKEHRQGRGRKASAELIGDRRPGYTRIAGDLAAYACNKAVAMSCRLKGDISAALVYEKGCDIIYDGLPEDLCW